MAQATDAGTVALRRLTAADLPAAHALSRAVGWPHRLEDWQLMLAPSIGFAAEADGALVGTALCWPYGDRVATVGLVLVAADRQGRGIGRRLMAAALEAAGPRTVLLNATQAGLPLYRALGFAPIGTVHQLQGADLSVPVAPLRPGERLRPIGRGDEAALAALDADATGMPRPAVMAALLGAAEGVILERDGEAVGFALFRRFGRGHVIGPVAAPDIDGAKALISHWIGAGNGRFIRIDVPEDSGLVDWLGGLGLMPAGPGITMARGTPPARGRRVRSFAIATQAMG